MTHQSILVALEYLRAHSVTDISTATCGTRALFWGTNSEKTRVTVEIEDGTSKVTYTLITCGELK